jgi:hypothetical protein
MKTWVLFPLAAALFLSGCATWYSQTPVGIRHTRMMVNSEQEYEYYIDPVERAPAAVSAETPFDRLKRLFSRSTD